METALQGLERSMVPKGQVERLVEEAARMDKALAKAVQDLAAKASKGDLDHLEKNLQHNAEQVRALQGELQALQRRADADSNDSEIFQQLEREVRILRAELDAVNKLATRRVSQPDLGAFSPSGALENRLADMERDLIQLQGQCRDSAHQLDSVSALNKRISALENALEDQSLDRNRLNRLADELQMMSPKRGDLSQVDQIDKMARSNRSELSSLREQLEAVGETLRRMSRSDMIADDRLNQMDKDLRLIADRMEEVRASSQLSRGLGSGELGDMREQIGLLGGRVDGLSESVRRFSKPDTSSLEDRLGQVERELRVLQDMRSEVGLREEFSVLALRLKDLDEGLRQRMQLEIADISARLEVLGRGCDERLASLHVEVQGLRSRPTGGGELLQWTEQLSRKTGELEVLCRSHAENLAILSSRVGASEERQSRSVIDLQEVSRNNMALTDQLGMLQKFVDRMAANQQDDVIQMRLEQLQNQANAMTIESDLQRDGLRASEARMLQLEQQIHSIAEGQVSLQRASTIERLSPRHDSEAAVTRRRLDQLDLSVDNAHRRLGALEESEQARGGQISSLGDSQSILRTQLDDLRAQTAGWQQHTIVTTRRRSQTQEEDANAVHRATHLLVEELRAAMLRKLDRLVAVQQQLQRNLDEMKDEHAVLIADLTGKVEFSRRQADALARSGTADTTIWELLEVRQDEAAHAVIMGTAARVRCLYTTPAFAQLLKQLHHLHSVMADVVHRVSVHSITVEECARLLHIRMQPLPPLLPLRDPLDAVSEEVTRRTTVVSPFPRM
eukprot:NODE_203_length_2771_cov_43.093681_g186_i0.p1 GENE.NODE_203_length_2771_cov_43.093681_g186_i0~~NODE_203_length_2771_cov_43.093681_g186_i0.p1  ORF type:complete len:900 (-),score=225.52 NODE_203_length_2771_cov_43.093681_g186_i0:70-2445(-)